MVRRLPSLACCGLALVINLLALRPATAAEQCYSPAELQSEQLLRLHSELMVITVTCRQGSDGQSLVPAYTGFTKTNVGKLKHAEETLIHYFTVNHKGDGISLLDKMRTKLGNEFGQKIADMSAPAFCQQYRDKVANFSLATPQQIDDEVQTMVGATTSYRRLCPGSESHIAKAGR